MGYGEMVNAADFDSVMYRFETYYPSLGTETHHVDFPLKKYWCGIGVMVTRIRDCRFDSGGANFPLCCGWWGLQPSTEKMNRNSALLRFGALTESSSLVEQ